METENENACFDCDYFARYYVKYKYNFSGLEKGFCRKRRNTDKLLNLIPKVKNCKYFTPIANTDSELHSKLNYIAKRLISIANILEEKSRKSDIIPHLPVIVNE